MFNIFQMIFPESLSPAQIAAVEELKRRTINDVTPKMLEDPYLHYRFLKARNFDLKKAEDMLRKSIAWRRENKVDNILRDFEPPEVMVKYFAYTFIGFDKEGYPVYYIDFGGDAKGMFSSVRKVDIIKYGIFLLEREGEIFKAQTHKLGKPITKARYISDFGNVTLSKATNKTSIEMLMLAAKIYQDNYPEHVLETHIINASIYYSFMLSIAKSVVAAELLDKIHILSPERQKEGLLEVIDADVLPAFLGGDKTDPDGNPLCNSFVIHAKEMPKSYFLKKSMKALANSPEAKTLTVTRFSKEYITFKIEEDDSFLEWEFETKNRDIGFGLHFKESSEEGSKRLELIPKQRIDTSFGPETGIFKCEQKGIYTITFDNSYSWIYSKEVFYKIRTVRPNEDGGQDDLTLQT